MLATRFDLGSRAAASKTTLLLDLEALLVARNAAGESSVLVVDEEGKLCGALNTNDLMRAKVI